MSVQLKLQAFRTLEAFKNLFLGYSLGKRIPLFITLYTVILNIFKPDRVKVFDHWLILNPKDKVMSNEFFIHGIFEEFEISLFSSVLKKGFTVFDIGANVGYYTLLAASKVGELGQVYAFEPEQENFEILNKNITLNGYHNVKLMKYAVSDENGHVEMSLSTDNMGDHRTHKSENAVEGRHSYQVKAVALDSLFEDEATFPDVIKMDIQGFEYFALQGMKELINRTSSLILLSEFWPYGMSVASGEDSPRLFCEILKSSGFKVFQIDESSKSLTEVFDVNKLISSLPGESFTNLACFKNVSENS